VLKGPRCSPYGAIRTCPCTHSRLWQHETPHNGLRNRILPGRREEAGPALAAPRSLPWHKNEANRDEENTRLTSQQLRRGATDHDISSRNVKGPHNPATSWAFEKPPLSSRGAGRRRPTCRRSSVRRARHLAVRAISPPRQRNMARGRCRVYQAGRAQMARAEQASKPIFMAAVNRCIYGDGPVG